MPELPEVETSLRGISPHLLGRRVTRVIVRESRLRWPIPTDLADMVSGHRIQSTSRRGKYLLIRFETGHLLLHLGMSGSLRICDLDTVVRKHDHFDLVLDDDRILRLHDPRRFGCVLWCDGKVNDHPLLRDLGPEPLGEDFDGDTLFRTSRGRKCNIKSFIMNSHIVVGVGNIYACESLFLAGINPKRAAGSLSRKSCHALSESIRQTLNAAIEQGGTTLRDFLREDGKPGYFKQSLNVYDRQDEPCNRCDRTIKHLVQQNRSTYYCTGCQR